MTVTPDLFRASYPAFADTTAFPDASVAYWLSVAALLLRPGIYGNTLDLATQMFVAHNLDLEVQAQSQAASGAAPTGPPGPVSSEGVGPLSTSYDTGAGVNADAGHWNLTIYGTRFIGLLRARTAGVGFCVGPRGGVGQRAWAGPPTGYIPGY